MPVMRLRGLSVLAFLFGCELGFAATLAEKAEESGCTTNPVTVEGALYRCLTKSGIAAYFRFPGTNTESPSGNARDKSGASPNRDSDVITLLCIASIRGQRLAQNLTIDYKTKSVNGASAFITQTMVTWSTEEYDEITRRSIVYHHELNRLAGTYSSRGEGIIYTDIGPSYICEKAPPQKF